MTKFRTQFNHAEFPQIWEKNDQPSKTLPDQAMSIKEIMRRYASGLPLGGGRIEIYEGDEDDFPDLTHLDLAERQEIIEARQAEFLDLQDKIDQDKKAKKAKKALEKLPTAADQGSQGQTGNPHENSKDDGRPSPAGNEAKKTTD